MEHRITIVGIGPGSPDYILPIATKAIQQAKVIIGSKRALDTLAPKTALTKTITKDIDGLLDFIATSLEMSDIVVMVSGDPGFYSLLSALKSRFSPNQLYVIPGISSIQAAFAKIGDYWHDADLISMHGRHVTNDKLTYYPKKKMGILTDGNQNPSSIAQMLLDNGWPPTTMIWLCAALSYDSEKVVQVTLAEALYVRNFAHCVMVVAG